MFKEPKLLWTTGSFSLPGFGVVSAVRGLNSGAIHSVSFSAACCILGLSPLSSPHSPFHQEWANSWLERSAAREPGWGQVMEHINPLGTKPGLGHVEKGKQHRCPWGF